MKIAVVAPFEEAVPPLTYGGTELVAANMIKNFVSMGHEVTLLGTGDSKVNAKVVPVFPRSIRTLKVSQDLDSRERLKDIGTGRVVEYFLKNRDFDIVHNHNGWRILPVQNAIGLPMITTMHGPLSIPYQKVIYSEYKSSAYTSISYNQRKDMPELNFVANVYNGILVDTFTFQPKPKGNYFAFLGRMSPEKAPVEAIKIAKKAGVRLRMAAKVDAVDKEYFEKQVKPLIDGKQIQFIGEVNHKQKVELLGNSLGLIAPIQWEEPFGLFFTEAMVCGAPVFACKRGSVPEVVVDGKTGFVTNNLDVLARRIKDVHKIDRKVCHEHVMKNFSDRKMAEGYLAAYDKVIKQFKKKPRVGTWRVKV